MEPISEVRGDKGKRICSRKNTGSLELKKHKQETKIRKKHNKQTQTRVIHVEGKKVKHGLEAGAMIETVLNNNSI